MLVSLLVFFTTYYISLLLHQIQGTNGDGNAGDDRYKIIGLFSACQQPHSFNQSIVTTKALIYKELSDAALTRNYAAHISSCNNFTQLITFESHDVCRNLTRLTEILINTSLNISYYSHIDSDDVVNQYKSSTVLMFLTYLTQELQLALASFSKIDSNRLKKPPITVVLNEHIVLPQAFQVGANILVSHKSDMIDQLISVFKWKRIGLVFLKRSGDDENEIYKERYESHLESMNILGLCFFNVTVDVDQSDKYQKTAEKIKLERPDVPIILYGHRTFLRNFIKTVGKDQKHGSTKRVWIGFDILTDSMEHPSSVEHRIISIDRAQHIVMRKFILKNRKYFQLPSPQSINSTNSTYEEAMLAIYAVKDITCDVSKSKFDIVRTRYQCGFVVQNIYTSDLVITRATPLYRVVKIIGKNLDYDDEVFHVLMESFQQQTNCSSVVCGKGFYQTFGKQSALETSAWNSSVGWTCRKCPLNYFKNSEGDAPCKRCPRYHSSNGLQTFCFDLYQETFLNTDLFLVQLTIAVSSSLVLITFVALSVFVIYRHTPLVQAMDFSLSIYHLLSIAVPLCFNLVVFQGKPNLFRCICRPASIAVFNSTTISIVLVKSQKLLQAFHSKVRLRHRQVLLTSLKQAAIIIVNISVAILLLLVTLNFRPSDIESVRRDDNGHLQLEMFCGGGTDLHINVQVVYQILLQIACFVPAFCGRNLPNVFNEAMSIIYASFVMNVAYMVLFPIQYFQRKMHYRAMVQWTVLNCNAFSIFFFLYGKKLYLVVFKPEKNTRAYFREQTMQSLKKKVQKLTTS